MTNSYFINKVTCLSCRKNFQVPSYVIEGWVEYVFYPPLLSDQICKIVRPMFRKKKPAAGEKILRSLFSKKLTFLGKFNGFQRFLTVFQRFSVPPRRKKPAAGEKFGNPFFCAPEAREKFSDQFFIFVRPNFHFGPIPPLKKFGDNV